MANTSQLFHDDEREHEGNGDDELAKILGTDTDEIAAMEREATNGAAADIAERNGFFKANGDNPESSKKPVGSHGDLASAEGGPSNFNFNLSDASPRTQIRMLLDFASAHKKGLIVGGGGGGIVIGVVVLIFFALIPLKIEDIVTNLQNHFFASAQNAMGDETDNLFVNYIKKEVGPALTKKNCGITISKDCTVNVLGNGNSPIDNLYRTWAQNKLENKLAEDYGIEFSYNSATRTYYMKAPGLSGAADEGEAISKAGEGHIDDTMFAKVDRGTIRQTVKDAVQGETRLQQVMFRYKVGRLLEEKYGIKRCLIFCGAQDALHDFTNQKKNAAELYLVQRVILPRNNSLGIVMACLLTPECASNSTKTTPETPDSTDGDIAAEPESPTDDAIREGLQKLATQYGIDISDSAMGALISTVKDISEKGYQNYIISKLLTSVGLPDITDQANPSAILNWINDAAEVISIADHVGPAVKKMAYVINSAAAVSLFEEYSTYASEIHTGHVDATELGSFTESLGPGNHDTSNPSDPEVGGTAGAEGTPLYSSLMDGEDSSGSGSTAASLLGMLLPPKAFADTSSSTASTDSASSDYLCSNNEPPTGEVCPEEVLGGGNNALNSISSTLNTFPFNILSEGASLWEGTIGKILNALGSLFSDVLGPAFNVLGISGLIDKVVTPFLNFITSQLIPNPFGTNMSGGRTFDMMAAGADVAGNDYSHYGLGGEKLTDAQAADQVNTQVAEAQQQFDGQPLFARMFSTSSPYSLVSKIADALPADTTAASDDLASILNPLSDLSKGFSSLFSTSKAFAAVQAQPDPFGVTQYGYPDSNDPVFTEDPDAYWTQHDCSNTSSTGPTYLWSQAASEAPPDPNTGMPDNDTTDGCLLLQAAVGSAGGYYNANLLTSDDLEDVSGN